MEKKRAKTVRMDAADWEAINSMKASYGIASDTDALRFASKLGQICTDFKVNLRKSARNRGIDHWESGKTALHLASSIDTW